MPPRRRHRVDLLFVTNLFDRLVATSGLPAIRLHGLGYGAATLILASGIDVKAVRRGLTAASLTDGVL